MAEQDDIVLIVSDQRMPGMTGVEMLARSREVEKSLARTARRARRVERELGEVRTSIDVLASRRSTLPILIDPTGLSRDQQPFFVECDSDGLTAPHKGLLKGFLGHCDLVKFAELRPATEDIQRTFDSCKMFIEETRMRQA